MKASLFVSNICFEKFEESSSSNTMIFEASKFEEEPKSKCETERNELFSNEITEMEQRIISWLHENQINISIPEEKEFQYYETKRSMAVNLKSRKSFSISGNPLLQRRRTSLTNLHQKDIEPKNSLGNGSPTKLSKFKTCKYLDLSFSKEDREERE
jgi:hypothetical protein